MGYQESFITSKDFDWLVDKVNRLGKQHFEDRFVSVVEMVTLDKPLTFNLEMMCQPEIEINCPEGMQFLWVCGERQYQRRLWGENGLLGEQKPNDRDVDIFFIECVSNQLLDKQNSIESKRNFTSEPFEYERELKLVK